MNKLAAGIIEALVVLVLGVGLAFGGNALYGADGIQLDFDYFPHRKTPDRPTGASRGDGQPDKGTTTTTTGGTISTSGGPTVVDPAGQVPGTGGDGTDGNGTASGNETTSSTTTQLPAAGTSPTPAQPTASGEPPYVEGDWFDLANLTTETLMGLDYVPAGSTHSFSYNELTSPQAQAFFDGSADRGIRFLDARTEDHWKDEHIPGAIALPRFYFKKFWPKVQGEVYAASAVVIYCAGGDCEDSEQLAQMLITEGGMQSRSIFIYRGGMKDWQQNGRELEKGK